MDHTFIATETSGLATQTIAQDSPMSPETPHLEAARTQFFVYVGADRTRYTTRPRCQATPDAVTHAVTR